MKNTILLFAFACAFCLITACSGNHTSNSGKDTVDNRFGTAKDTSKPDTGKTISPDMSASGGTKNDTLKKDSVNK